MHVGTPDTRSFRHRLEHPARPAGGHVRIGVIAVGEQVAPWALLGVDPLLQQFLQHRRQTVCRGVCGA